MLQATNINTTIVANELGVASRNIGELCTNQKVNKWSFWKPVYYPSINGITDSVLYWVNDGFNLPLSGMQFPGLAEAFANKNSSGYWEYIKPEGDAESPYRIGDFRNYDHDQNTWFDIHLRGTEFNTVTVSPGATVNVAFNYPKQDKTFLTEHLFKLRSFMELIHGSYSSVLGLIPEEFIQDLENNPKQQVAFTFGLIFREPSVTGKEYLFYKMFDLITSGDEGEELIVKIPELTDGFDTILKSTTYEVTPCITTYTSGTEFGKFEIINSETDSNQWFVFPTTNPLQVTIDREKEEESVADIEIGNIIFVDESGVANITLNKLKQIYCTITNNSDKDSYSGSIRANIENMSGFGEVMGTFTDIPAGGSANVILWDTKDESGHIEFATTDFNVKFTETITHRNGIRYGNPPVNVTTTLREIMVESTPIKSEK